METSPDFQGRSYEAEEQEVDRERHLAYALSVGVEPDLARRLPRPLGCFAAVYLLWPVVPLLFSDTELALDLQHLLHGEQEFSFGRPVRFGERIRPRGEIRRLEARSGMVFLDFLTQGRDPEGAVVATSRTLFVIRGLPA
ncbi:MAG: FAS1-like dehydratase domain-containing protein [Candidatus Dormibacteria bacterium]